MLEAPKIEQGPGVRGRVAFFVKRVIRKLSRWYVEPRFNEIRAHLEDQRRTTTFLRKELDQMHREMSQLSLRLHQLEEEKKTSL
jgi:hypothetical protein